MIMDWNLKLYKTDESNNFYQTLIILPLTGKVKQF